MESKIIKGQKRANYFSEISMGEIFFNTLTKQNKDYDILIDGTTNESLTCGEILQQSVQLARAFIKLGLKENDVFAIVSENNINYLTPVIAGFYIGLIANPINPDYNKRELKNAFDISKPKIVFTSEKHSSLIVELKNELDYLKHVIVFDSEKENVISFKKLLASSDGDVSSFKPVTFENSDMEALILNSSGTTGLPKGVMLTHENIKQTYHCFADPKCVEINPKKSTIGLLPYYHVFGINVAMACLTLGMKVFVLNKFIPDIYLEIIQKNKITTLFVVPSLALFLAKSSITDSYDLSSVTYIISGASPIGTEVQNLIQKKFNVKLRQAYGLTEVSGCVTVENITPEAPQGSCGYPVANTDIKVIDLETSQILGPNEIGEICCKSPFCMKSYVQNEQATKEIFDEDSFLHTGDLGYYDNNGFFYVVDRLKELIKYKGFQVSPAEIENLLISHKSIKEAAVIGIPDERSGELTKAFIVKQPGSKITEDEIIKFIESQVSVHKRLHGGVKFIDEIPKGATGKILRKELRALYAKK